jgi:hypothetical protein
MPIRRRQNYDEPAAGPDRGTEGLPGLNWWPWPVARSSGNGQIISQGTSSRIGGPYRWPQGGCRGGVGQAPSPGARGHAAMPPGRPRPGRAVGRRGRPKGCAGAGGRDATRPERDHGELPAEGSGRICPRSPTEAPGRTREACGFPRPAVPGGDAGSRNEPVWPGQATRLRPDPVVRRHPGARAGGNPARTRKKNCRSPLTRDYACLPLVAGFIETLRNPRPAASGGRQGDPLPTAAAVRPGLPRR